LSYDDITPARVIRENFRWLPAILIVGGTLLALLLITVLVCWRAHVWFWEQNVKIQNNVYQNSYATQHSDIDSMNNAMQAIPSAMTSGQIKADVDQACSDGAQVNTLPPGDATWYAANCAGGVISPGSVYNTMQPQS
jgi:hypothetical protein